MESGPPPPAHMLPAMAAPAPSLPHTARKRARELESPEQRSKREKATERQRRKRARDREALLSNSELAPMAHAEQPAHFEHSPHSQLPPPPGDFAMPDAGPSQPPPREPTAEEIDAMRAVEQARAAEAHKPLEEARVEHSRAANGTNGVLDRSSAEKDAATAAV